MTTSLRDVLQARITASGPISVAEYMQLCLTHPEHGYYVGQEAFGGKGDFVTAPEISQTFGEMLGLWAAEVWLSMGKPTPFHLVELGPGRGTLLADALRLLSRALPDFTAAAEIHLVEVSPRLRGLQRDALSPFTNRVQWHGTFAEVPQGPTIVIANEFLDALPIQQFVRSHDGWHERLVGEGVGGPETLGFCLDEHPTPDPYFDHFSRVPVESIVERRMDVQVLGQEMSERFSEAPGAALLIDYGYAESEIGDTFQAVKDHKPVHVLQYPGESDLTAHVDFQQLQDLLRGGVARLTTQGDFLKSLGVEARLQQLLAAATEEQRDDLASGVERLIDPAQMGSLFKVLCFTSHDLATPPGFAP